MTLYWTRPSADSQRPLDSQRSLNTQRSRRALLGLAALATVQLSGETASAEKMDFALERLAENSAECRTSEGFAIPGQTCIPDEQAFLRLINQYGMAFAPTSMYPARTTGYGGFEITLEGNYTTVNGKSDYMRLGTRGQVSGTTGEAAEENTAANSMLQLYSLRIRKGFGFGFETGLQFGFMPNTSMISGGADLRMSVLEGFRSGVPGYFPDLTATGSVRTITGTPQVQLTVVGVSGMISKPITIADSGVLTPWAGYQHLFIFGDSGVIDFTPAESALQACGYAGPNIPGTPGSDINDGSPVCDENGRVNDFNNNQVFTPVRIQRQRLLFGGNYRYEILTLGMQFMVDPFSSAENLNSDQIIVENEAKSESDVFAEEKAEGGNVHNFGFAIQVGAQF